MVTAIRKTSAWPLAAQLAFTFVATVGVFLIQFPLDSKGFGHPFALFLSCVFMVALMFGRPSGFFAVALSTLLSTAFFAPVSSIHLMRAFEYFQIEIYVALAVGATIMADQIHRVPFRSPISTSSLLVRTAGRRCSCVRWRTGSPTTLRALTRSSGKGPWRLRILRFNSPSGRQAS